MKYSVFVAEQIKNEIKRIMVLNMSGEYVYQEDLPIKDNIIIVKLR